MAIDKEFENLKRKHLAVMNAEAPISSEFCLEDPGEAPPDGPVDATAVRERIVEALKTVYDPEIPLNIYELGLIYGFEVDESGNVDLQMTLTAPGCPVAGSLVREVHDKVRSVRCVRRATTTLVWDPPWSRDRMSEAAQLQLGLL